VIKTIVEASIRYALEVNARFLVGVLDPSRSFGTEARVAAMQSHGSIAFSRSREPDRVAVERGRRGP
jgi:hypothetical protein